VVHPEIFPEVQSFMMGMQLLGEPFVFGVKSAKEFMESNGFRCHEIARSDVFFAERSDPVYSIYHFCTASAEVGAPAAPSSKKSSWTTHPAHLPIPLVNNPGQTLSGEAAQS